MNKIILPKKDDEGSYYISYSQIKLWNDLKSFNLKEDGRFEYILSYFFNEEWPDQGWAQFGTEVEEYITERKFKNQFDDKEKFVLDQIKTLGNFQVEGRINFDDFHVLLYIDDATDDLMWIRDYKTASLNSAKKYYKDDYWQLDVYGMWVKQEKGKLPERAEVAIIEREGNCFRGGGRGVLRVKDKVWFHKRELTEERQEELKETILRTVQEISDCYKVYLKVNKSI